MGHLLSAASHSPLATKSRSGQGLPMNTIVIAIIAIVMLVLIILFATGSLSKLFKSERTIEDVVTPDEAAAFRLGCEQACQYAKQLVDSEAEWDTSGYCTRMLSTYACWNATQKVECEFTASNPNGATIKYNKNCCGADPCT